MSVSIQEKQAILLLSYVILCLIAKAANAA